MSGTVGDLYRTLAQACFTLLGLWWLVVVNHRQDWMPNPELRRRAWHVSMLFLLPGTASLLALLSPEAVAYWRVPFVVAGLVGAGVAVSALTRADTTGRRLVLAPIAVLYALVALVAAFPGLVGDVGIGLRPVVVEATLAALALFLGVQLAWHVFAEAWQRPPAP
jgi:hypothetical protein